jgi:hypothetical protein
VDLVFCNSITPHGFLQDGVVVAGDDFWIHGLKILPYIPSRSLIFVDAMSCNNLAWYGDVYLYEEVFI